MAKGKVVVDDKSAKAFEEIVGLVEGFCKSRLNDEYASICRRLAEKLHRKRPSPLVTGKPASWACGIVRTIGWVNFLDDPTQTPHMKLSEIDMAFGVSSATGAAKSSAIRKLLKIGMMQPEWSTAHIVGENPLTWMVEIDGFLVDVRKLDRAIQERAFELGLIPYIPDDQPA